MSQLVTYRYTLLLMLNKYLCLLNCYGLSWYIYPLFFFAGLLAGFINTLAGNGSVFTLSLLLFSGMPAGLANGTNRVGALVQCIVSMATFRNRNQFKPLLKIVLF